MSTGPLLVRRVRVDRLYGLDHAGIEADGLASGVNVVYGPNANGKTTFGRAVHALVWPESVTGLRPVISGSFELGPDHWRLDIDGSALRCQRGDTPSDPPALPEASERARYTLSLHDLLHSDGRDFAGAVARFAAGGMDIEASAGALKFSDSTPKKGAATAAAEGCRGALREAESAQAELDAARSDLDDLKEARSRAAASQETAGALALARDYALSSEAEAEARTALEELPESLAHVREDDAEALAALREQEAEARRAAARATSDVEDAVRRLAENAVESSGLTAPVEEVEALLAEIRAADDVMNRKGDDLAGLREVEADAARRIGSDVEIEKLAEVDDESVRRVEEHAVRAARLHGDREVLRGIRSIAKSIEVGYPTPEEAESAARAARALRDWLRVQREAPPGPARTLAVVGAVACAAFGAALALLGHPVGLALLVPSVLLAALYWLVSPGDDRRAEDAQDRFERLGLTPVQWAMGAVEARLEELDDAVAGGAVARRAREYVAATSETLGDVDACAREVEAVGGALCEEIGFQPGVEGARLAYLIGTVRTYQDARARRLGAERAVDEAADRRERALGRAAELLAPFDIDAPHDAAALSERASTLRALALGAKQAQDDHDAAQAALERAKSDSNEAAGKVSALFSRLRLEPTAGDGVVAQAVGSLEVYASLSRKVTESRAEAQAALRRLRAHAGFEVGFEDLSATEAGRRLEEADVDAMRYRELTERIAAVEARVEAAQRSRDLEAARARLDQANDVLLAARDRAADARLGRLLADHASRSARETQVPPVLRRASEILGLVTGHRYSLTFDPRSEAFVAVDTVRDRAFSLDELSSGTRVQLLLSVRVAFVEQQERGARLPLVLDELLANSDETRAAAITATVLGLCRAGRQVFYLTSRPDEVAKWQRLAAEHPDVDCAFIPLGDGASAPDAAALPDLSFAPPLQPVGSHDHSSYGVVLGVPRWTGHDDVGALHLWYAIDKPEELYATLEAGVSRLGPALRALDSGSPIGLSQQSALRLTLLSDALSAWKAAWRVGRGAPLTPEALEACPAISARYSDRVTAYAADIGWDGRRLVDGLRNGEVDRFRSKNVNELEEHLVELGHIDEAPSLSAEEVWSAVLERVGPDCSTGNSTIAEVKTFLDRVAGGPG